MDCSLSGRILQAKILEWVAMPSSRGSSQPTDRTQVSSIADRRFTVRTTREAQNVVELQKKNPMNLWFPN